jgi:hypothetical protein
MVGPGKNRPIEGGPMPDRVRYQSKFRRGSRNSWRPLLTLRSDTEPRGHDP